MEPTTRRTENIGYVLKLNIACTQMLLLGQNPEGY